MVSFYVMNTTMQEKIEEALTKFPKAKRIAVENFCHTCPQVNSMHDNLNLQTDARLYGWHQHTVCAIKQVLDL